jgi:hypothetical protein
MVLTLGATLNPVLVRPIQALAETPISAVECVGMKADFDHKVSPKGITICGAPRPGHGISIDGALE